MASYLDKVLGLVEQAERGVPRTVASHRHDVFEVFEAAAKVRTTVLLKFVMSRPETTWVRRMDRMRRAARILAGIY